MNPYVRGCSRKPADEPGGDLDEALAAVKLPQWRVAVHKGRRFGAASLQKPCGSFDTFVAVMI